MFVCYNIIEKPKDEHRGFFRYIRHQLINRYCCLNFFSVTGESPCFVAGSDLLRLEYAYQYNDSSYLPRTVNLYYCRNQIHLGNIVSNPTDRSNKFYIDDDLPDIFLMQNFQLNCLQRAINIKNGTIIQTRENKFFEQHKEAFFVRNDCMVKAKIEAESIQGIKSIYFKKSLEYGLLMQSYNIEATCPEKEGDLKLISLFMNRIILYERKKTMQKVKMLLSTPKLLKIILDIIEYSVIGFDLNFKGKITTSELEKCQKLIKHEAVENYLYQFPEDLETALKGLATLSSYFKKYPKFLIAIFRLNDISKYGILDQEKLQNIIKDPVESKKLGSYFLPARESLDINEFRQGHSQIYIKELLSPYEMTTEGEEMKHCTGNQDNINKLKNGHHFFSIKCENLRSTLEVTKNEMDKFYIVDHQMKFNASPITDLKDLASELVNVLNKKGS
jgi:hypothetical protein